MSRNLKLLFLGLFTVLNVCTTFAQRTVQDMLRPAFDSSQVIHVVIDTLVGLPPNNVPLAPQIALPLDTMNYVLDKTRIVGDVPYELGTSIAGQVELSIPIETFASEYESAPQIELKYSSLGGITYMGRGWNISGLSQIETANKTYFTDGNVAGRDRDNGPWALDGNRLILQQTTDTTEVFLTQTGNIKVIRYLDEANGYLVYLPDGSVNTYNVSSGSCSRLYLKKSTALDGREISYSYYNDANIKLIESIDYGEGRSMDFTYADAANEQTFYVDGIPLVYRKKLSRIDVKRDDHLLRQYVLTYRNTDITAPLVQVDMLDSVGNAVNPLHFYYHGDNASHGSVSQTNKHMFAHFSFQNPESFISFRGKLDYISEDDAIIIYPNKRNYYIRERKYVRNDYSGNDTITVNYNLNGYASHYDVLNVGQGFVDAFCMDVDGNYGEELVMVNQNVYNTNYDRLQFTVYQHHSSGLIPIDTLNYDFNALNYQNKKSVWPTQFLTGDFTGDGKNEILMCRTSNPLGGGETASVRMINLAQDTIIYNGELDAFHLYVYDNQYSQEQNLERARNCDRLLATDLDGDGKLEMCVLNNSGLDIYRFSYNTSGQVVMAKSNYHNLVLSQAHDYNVTVADVNGDVNTDLVLLPVLPSKIVKSYISQGDGNFILKPTNIFSYSGTSFMCFDYNQDGQTDIVRYFMTPDVNVTLSRQIKIYSLKNGTEDQVYSIDHDDPSILVPMSFFGQNSNIAMLSIKSGGLYDIHRCSNPASMDALMVGVADSRGCISQMQYRQLYQSEYYAPGFDAVFPYTTYAGNMFVCSGMTKRAGNTVESSLLFNYNNATIHRQGLGFCGFRSVQTIDNVRGESSIQEFSPEDFGVPVYFESPREKRFYTYNTCIDSDRRIKVLLTADSTMNNLTGVTTSSTYGHDSYGNRVSAVTRTGGYIKAESNVYRNVVDGNRWIIGAETQHFESLALGSQIVVNGRSTCYDANWLPDTVITWRGYEQHPVSTKYIRYDALKRPDRIKTKAYSGTTLKRYIDYEGSSRIPIGKSDEKGMYVDMTFGDFGIVESSIHPDRLPRNDNDEPSPEVPSGGGTSLGGGDELNGGGFNGIINPGQDFGNPINTSYHYDSLGRVDTTTVSDGTVRTVAYSWTGDDMPNALTLVESSSSGEPMERTWFDALGRKVQTAIQRFDGLWAKTAIQYDTRGRVSAVSQPFTGNAASQWTAYAYDSHDRLTEKEYPDSHTDTYAYNGLTTSVTIDGLTSSRTVDVMGNLVAVTDGGGTIAYTLRPDGQPDEIRVGGMIATTFEYDLYGRRTAINDPSAGRRTTSYDSNGFVSCETDARGKSVTSMHSGTGRLMSRTYSDGRTVSFTYDSWNNLKSMTDGSGRNKSWSYNSQHKLSNEVVGTNGFKKTFTYAGNQVASVAYYKGNTYICTENYNRQNGHIASITLNTGDTIWTLREQDSRFLPVKLGMGKLGLAYSYDLRGNVTSRSATRAVGDTIQWMTCSYSAATGNMTSRTDMVNGLEEEFGYDSMNRLTDISLTDPYDSVTEKELLYDGKGNVLSRTDAGQFGYDTTLPYAMSGLTSPAVGIPMREQYLHYNAMQQPDTIIENGYTATFSYYGDRSRAGMTVAGPNGYQYSCNYYDQRYNYFTKTENNVTTHKTVLWLGGSPYNAPAAMLKDYGSNTWRLVYVLRDNLGSITHVVDTAGVVLQEMGYDAWGQLRDPQTGTVYGVDAQPELLLGRGYTGHEHLPWFGLVNMNARLYDPAVGRFLSPDPIMQAPDNTQNFNRYSYCLNNPLRYADILGLIYTTYYDDYTIDGENIRTHRVLDDVVIVGFNNNRNNASMNISFSDGFISMGSLSFYANWTSQYHVTGNQNMGNGNGNTFFGGGGGASAQLSYNPINWSQYYLTASPSSPQSFWQSLIIGASGLNQRLGIANGYIKYAFEHLSTEDKSKLVYDLSKEIESITGNKIRNYSNLYRNSIPKFFDKAGTVLSLGSYSFTFADVLQKREFLASHFLDASLTTIGWLCPYGWAICGVYYGSNLIIQGVTGKEIGDYLNEFINDEFGVAGGTLIRW